MSAGTVQPAGSPPSEFTFTGSGWGHGMGMSQYGAYGQALEGRSAAQILGQYYSPAVLTTRSDDPTIRVQVRYGTTSVTVYRDSTTTWKVGTGPDTSIDVTADSITFTYSTATGTARVSTTVGGAAPRTNPSTWPELTLSWTGRVTLPGADAGYGTVRYTRGMLSFGPLNGGVNVVDSLKLNSEYLYGIAEMPSSWPSAALQAQAIAARTYAYRKYLAGVRSSIGAHLTDEPTDQKFTGANKELEATWGVQWVAAVDATRPAGTAQVLTYQGDMAQTFYSSSTGGATTNSEDVWGGSKLTYLRSADDHWSVLPAVHNPRASWTITKSQAQVKALFPGLGDVAYLTVTQRASSGAAMQLKATSSTGQERYLLSRPTTDGVRTTLGLYSAYVSVSGHALAAVQRYAGADRYGTAVSISGAAYPTGSEVVLVSGAQSSLVDGLVAAPFARLRSAPVLLASRDGLPAATLAELQRRAPTKVWLIGGSGVLGPRLVAQLRTLGVKVQRLAGDDRYATAAAVAAQFGTATDVVVASGAQANLVDAAAAGGPAAATRRPVVLTRPDALTPVTAKTIKALGATRALVVGGEGAVAGGVADALTAAGVSVTRAAGADRYATAVAVAGQFATAVGTGTVVVASGRDANLIDSLTGGVLGHLTLLVDGARLPEATAGWLAGHRPTLLQVAGGTGAVPDSVVEAMR
ncbi:hypothetical protein CCO02nite_18200 [Cellulomonas composti]|uniref:Sporulation stage II protein D amidase enhancer LytB N-terminal domain-containing protein n=1 Tax=Cellulomonas composti TaxID=266130 RepID=A0A511JAZ8_9CELL|nr:hypothetical protein CCO02nite_18200 [Cellulomonas composti]